MARDESAVFTDCKPVSQTCLGSYEGGRMLFLSQGRIHLLSLVDHRVLWSLEIPKPGPQDHANVLGMNGYNASTRYTATAMSAFIEAQRPNVPRNGNFPALLTDRYAAYTRRRELIVVDSTEMVLIALL